MTEAEWLASSDAVKMLKFLKGRAGDRKLRLFACACCRRIWHLMDDGASRQAVEVAERYADGLADGKELAGARSKVRDVTNSRGTSVGPHWLAGCTLRSGMIAAARAVAWTLRLWEAEGLTRFRDYPGWKAGEPAGERPSLAAVLRDVVGNPFRPLAPRAFPPTVQGLARAIHEGDHSLYPLLADALDDLGEGDAATHCRGGEHVKGCHVVDWVLGKG